MFVVSDENVAPLYLNTLRGALSFTAVDEFVLPPGEAVKTLGSVQRIFDAMLAVPCDRRTTLIALGGGVVGDIAGFAAACYQRGIDFLQVPTTLLAQVDSSVGGKTGVNHPLGKNMIGAFHQPRGVLVDIDTLKTLDRRQLLAGIAEVVKHAAIADAAFFDWLEVNRENLLGLDPEAHGHAIKRCCEIKAAVVSRDEREGGLRAILNFGHTFGHAIETLTGYETWLHGEAVACGMVLAGRLSANLGLVDAGVPDRIERLLLEFGLPAALPEELAADDILACMARDKKAIGNNIRLVLLTSLGRARIVDDTPAQTIRSVL